MKPLLTFLFCLMILMGVVSGCLSARNHPALDAIRGDSSGGGASSIKGSENIVEAYFEFPGPQDRWAGPVSFVLHVAAKDPHWATIHAAPAWFNEDDRAEPWEQPNESGKVNTKGLSSDYARERLRYLAGTILGAPAEPPFRGCMVPIRVRLIRDDSTFIEKTGCRSETGWPKLASDLVEYFMTAKLRGSVDLTPMQ